MGLIRRIRSRSPAEPPISFFDIDPQRPTLRLAAEPKPERSLTASETLALREAEMEASIARWSEAFLAWRSERAQAQPISAVRDGNVRY